MAGGTGQTCEGILYDSGNDEVAARVAYRVEPGPVVGRNGATGSRALFFPNEDEEIDAGLSVVELEDGAQVDPDLDARGVEDGDRRTATVRGVGGFGQRIL